MIVAKKDAKSLLMAAEQCRFAALFSASVLVQS